MLKNPPRSQLGGVMGQFGSLAFRLTSMDLCPIMVVSFTLSPMTSPTPKHAPQDTPPKDILELITAFMLAIKAARLYAKGHALCKKNVQQLYTWLEKALSDRDFLIIGCTTEGISLEGTEYQASNPGLKQFLKFFHNLGISNIQMDREIMVEELQSFVELLAGAGKGQGEEVSSALPQEDITHARVGLLGASSFSTVQNVAAQCAQTSGDEAIWRQLILQPAATGKFSLRPKQIKQLTQVSQDREKFKKLLMRLDGVMTEKQESISPFQRGVLLGNFIQNLSGAVAGADQKKKEEFAGKMGEVIDSLDAKLKTHILGAEAPAISGQQGGTLLYRIFQIMPETRIVHLLVDALGEADTNSPCFNNLFKRALANFDEPERPLSLIRQEMQRMTEEKKPIDIDRWQYLEQLFLDQLEAEDLNQRYYMEIAALATSLQLKVPMAEEQEKTRLLRTLRPGSLKAAKAILIIDLINQPHIPQSSTLLPDLLKSLGEILRYYLSQESYVTTGNILRALYLALKNFSREPSVWEAVNALLTAKDLRDLLSVLLKSCHTYEPKETSIIDAICQLYPEKGGSFLLDLLMDIENEEDLRSQWLFTTVAGLVPRIPRVLKRKFQDAPNRALTRLLALTAISADKLLAATVEKLLDREDHEILLEVVRTLGQLRAERSVPRLGEIVFQKSWVKSKKTKSLQKTAVRALAEIGTDGARSLLQKAMTQGSGDLRAMCEGLV